MTRSVRNNVYWRITGKILRSSDKAICMQMTSLQGMQIKTAPTWFPRSQIESVSMGGTGEEDSFNATEWILEQKGFASDLAKVTGKPQHIVVDRFPDDLDADIPF